MWSALRRGLPIVAAAPVVLGALTLGRWQLRRDVERNAPHEAAAAVAELPVATSFGLGEDPTWRRVRFTGRREGGPQLESGIVEAGAAGYRRYDRFVADGGDVWLVAGGWVPHEGLAAALSVPLPDAVEGQGRPARGAGEAAPLAERDGATIWGPGAAAAMAAHVGARGLVVDTRLWALPPVPEPDPTSRHYAWQWFGIAAIAAGFAGVAARRGPARG